MDLGSSGVVVMNAVREIMRDLGGLRGKDSLDGLRSSCRDHLYLPEMHRSQILFLSFFSQNQFCESKMLISYRCHSKGTRLDKGSAGWISAPTFFLSQVCLCRAQPPQRDMVALAEGCTLSHVVLLRRVTKRVV